VKENSMPMTDTTTPFFTQAAKTAGLTILSAEQATDSQGRPTYRYHFGSAARTGTETQGSPELLMELSEAFQIGAAEMQEGLVSHLAEAAKRLRNPRPEAYVTLAGLPISIREFKWPLHLSTSGADTFLIHGTVFLEDGHDSTLPGALHAKISAAVTVTFSEIVAAPEQPFAEGFIYNAIRKTLDQGQLELLKSGNRQPVPVTTRYYSRWQKKFVFADTTAEQRREFLALKTFWLSGTLGGNQPVWVTDPRDAQYLNTTPDEMKQDVQQQAAEGWLTLSDNGDFAVPTPKLMERSEAYHAKLDAALAETKPAFNEEMRAGHTNM
jgi:hypothetical protein